MKTLIVGMGEVGRALDKVLSPIYETYTKDLDSKPVEKCEIMHVCIRYTPDFLGIVEEYADKSEASIINVCTTVPPGTTRKLGFRAVHSTTRGLHPHLEESILTFVKHIGGPQAPAVAEYFEAAGVTTKTHATPETTETAHVLANAAYGVQLLLADQLQAICRHYGVDYVDAVMGYIQTQNEGYMQLGHPSKVRMILTPPNGVIGGHCVKHSASLLPSEVLQLSPFIKALAEAKQ